MKRRSATSSPPEIVFFVDRNLGRRGWIVLTADQRLRRVSLETEAIMTAGVRVFLFPGKTDVRRFAEAFLKARSRIEQLIANTRSAFIAKIYRDGTVTLVLTCDEWEAGQ